MRSTGSSRQPKEEPDDPAGDRGARPAPPFRARGPPARSCLPRLHRGHRDLVAARDPLRRRGRRRERRAGEPRGRADRGDDHGGDEAVWGTILAFEPPHRLVFDWHPGYEPGAPKTEIEVRFTPEGEGTRVELEHRGWERLADRGPEVRLSYEDGWAYVFGRLYAEAAASGDGT